LVVVAEAILADEREEAVLGGGEGKVMCGLYEVLLILGCLFGFLKPTFWISRKRLDRD
jgi:hypothetical protein